jgi:regulator of extracellular matrix RemA (YlzA/DUF370 family)
VPGRKRGLTAVKKSAPSGRELEIALHQLLRKNHFAGVGHISVLVVGPKTTPVYRVTLDTDSAKVLGELLDALLGRRTQPSPTEWVLFRDDAAAILKAAADQDEDVTRD